MLDVEMKKAEGKLDGEVVFVLYDTFGFPIDLTRLIAKENNIEVDEEGFAAALNQQKQRSKKDAKSVTSDWEVLVEDELEEFIGYDYLTAEVQITRFREVKKEKKSFTHLAFDLTPFYAESGGQVGDTGIITGLDDGEEIPILDTIKENNLIIHLVAKAPKNPKQRFQAQVNKVNRLQTAGNHSATHLLHSALREILGSHVEQKGSLVDPDKLRFDFAHFSKVTDEELLEVEQMVNQKIRQGIVLGEDRNMPIRLAKQKGATALFGEKYGDTVRMITFDPDYSIELCGGTHVKNTAEIGFFKIVSEASVAAGIRRIEAVTQNKADKMIRDQIDLLKRVQSLLGDPKDLVQALQQLKNENQERKKIIDEFESQALNTVKVDLMNKAVQRENVNLIIHQIAVPNPGALKDLGFQLKNEVEDAFVVLASDISGKPSIVIAISDSLVKANQWNAGKLIKQVARHIKGGGGGQPFIAQAGGSDVSGIDNALEEAKNWVKGEV
jgi:alanyl-tRNA synthetase